MTITPLLVAAAIFIPSVEDVATPKPTPLVCEVGPVNRTFGGTSWIVYGCDDGKSLAAISEPGNPASPFVFIVAWKNGEYVVSGEGDGSREASSLAYDALRALSKDEIEALYDSAQAAAGVTR